MTESPTAEVPSEVPVRESQYLAVVVGIGLSGLYVGTLLFTTLLEPYRFRTPFAIPIFDVPFALVAIGIGYLCLERHRLRQDRESAAIGITLLLTALLAIAQIAAQPAPEKLKTEPTYRG